MARGRSPAIAAATTGSRLVLDPAHQQALLQDKRKARESTRAGQSGTGRSRERGPAGAGLRRRRIGRAPDRATARAARSLRRRAMRRAVHEALERNTPRASSVAFLLRQCNRAMPLPLDLSRHPQAQNLEVRPHDLETYDELAHRRDEEPES